jgi:small multidrug resistance pump
MYQAYLVLLLSIVSENIGTTFLKGSDGFRRPLHVAGALAGYTVNFVTMARVLALLPMAIAYGLWSGLGMALVTALGVFVYGEVFNRRIAFGLALILAGVLILNSL